MKIPKKYIYANIVLIGIIIVIALVILGITRINNSKATYAKIYYEDKLIKTIDLSKEVDSIIQDIELKDGLSIKIEYKKGAIRVIEAPCHTKECIQSGWTTSVNKPIICLDLHYKIVLVSNQAEVDVSI